MDFVPPHTRPPRHPAQSSGQASFALGAVTVLFPPFILPAVSTE